MNTITIRPFAALKFFTLAALALAMLLLNSCDWVGEKGNGNITTETRAIGDFSTLEADGAFKITWRPGPAAFAITTDENLHQYISTSSDGEKLRINWHKPLKGTRGIKVQVSSSALTRAGLNGAVKLDAANLSGTEFYVEANGATGMTLAGNVNAMSGEMNGASKLNAEALNTRAMELVINGAGKADVNVSEALKVEISGAGKVTYTGNPTVSQEINGAGRVRKRD